MTDTTGQTTPTEMVRVWDPMVRAFHWTLVITFAIAWVSAEGLLSLHEIAGYTVAGLVAFRLVWGLIGGRYARFTQFIKGPTAVIDYLRAMRRGTERRYLGHNPAGAAMIVALLLALSGTAFTGWLIADSVPGQVPGLLKGVHELFANGMMLLIVLHIAGVLFASRKHKENLAKAMVTGEKRPAGPNDIA